ncbi:MAG: peptide chain release factor 1 [Candidatus Cloacimonetes bacterium]|nr:peptide chain release factor 1 [Candidatus Cloacimonadota bacterium]
MIPTERLEAINTEYESLRQRIADPAEMNDQRAYKKLNRKFSELQEIINVIEKLEKNKKQLEQAKNLIHTEKDHDMIAMAKEEIADLEADAEALMVVLKDMLAPKDPNDEKNVIIEIRAGTGGEEAALFVADLYRMYTRYADTKKWSKTEISVNPTGLGGFKEVIFSLDGQDVYGNMRFEAGVHRVQRVPETEAMGRVHTSAITVAVLPEAEEIDLVINDSDIKIDITRSSGAGGQHVNTTDSAVRLTHLPTGLVVVCQNERSQIQNKAKAMNVLRSRLLDIEIAKQEAEVSSSRKAQVGTGDRSAKIRTYNFPQSRITDHRINLTTYQLTAVLSGELDEFIDALKIAYKNERLS